MNRRYRTPSKSRTGLQQQASQSRRSACARCKCTLIRDVSSALRPLLFNRKCSRNCDEGRAGLWEGDEGTLMLKHRHAHHGGHLKARDVLEARRHKRLPRGLHGVAASGGGIEPMRGCAVEGCQQKHRSGSDFHGKRNEINANAFRVCCIRVPVFSSQRRKQPKSIRCCFSTAQVRGRLGVLKRRIWSEQNW